MAENYDEIDLLEVIGLIWRHKILVFLATFAPPLLLGAFFALRAPEVAPPVAVASPIAASSLYFESTQETDSSQGYLYLEALLSNRLYEKLLREQKITAETLSAFHSQVDAKYDPRSRVLKVQLFSGGVPLLQEMLAGVSAIFSEFNLKPAHTLIDPPHLTSTPASTTPTASSTSKIKAPFLVVLSSITGLFGGIMLILFLNFVKKVKADPALMRKLTDPQV